MKLVLIIAYTLLLSSCYYKGMIDGVMILAVIGLFYAFLVERDLFLVGRWLSKYSPVEPKVKTSGGRVCVEGLMSTKYRNQLLSWQLQSAEHKGQSKLEVSEKDDKRAFETLLAETEGRFLAQWTAILIGDAENNISVFSRGEGVPSHKRLEFIFASEKHRSGAARAVDERSIVLGSLADTGFPCTARVNKTFNLHGRTLTVVIILGYSSARVLNTELSRLNELLHTVCEELMPKLELVTVSSALSVAEHQNKKKDEFLTQVSHDIRAPMNNIQVTLKLLELEASSDDREAIAIAIANCDHLRELVEDILDLARHRSGKLDARKETTDLSSLARAVAETHSVTARVKGLSVAFTSGRSISALVDKRHVKRVITNLITNAIKYTKQGQIDVECGEIGNSVYISVRDTGVGMSAQQIDKLFIPFTRFHDEGEEGAGLGLTLSRILVEMNGGKIEVNSEVGKGSEFKLIFPESQPLTEQDSNKVRGEIHPLSSVLVVDDDEHAASSLARVLKTEGVQVQSATSLKEATEKMATSPIVALITDINMPDGDGSEVVRQFKLRFPNGKVAVLSGEERNSFKAEELQTAGAEKFFVKPADVSEIRNWLTTTYFNTCARAA